MPATLFLCKLFARYFPSLRSFFLSDFCPSFHSFTPDFLPNSLIFGPLPCAVLLTTDRTPHHRRHSSLPTAFLLPPTVLLDTNRTPRHRRYSSLPTAFLATNRTPRHQPYSSTPTVLLTTDRIPCHQPYPSSPAVLLDTDGTPHYRPHSLPPTVSLITSRTPRHSQLTDRCPFFCYLLIPQATFTPCVPHFPWRPHPFVIFSPFEPPLPLAPFHFSSIGSAWGAASIRTCQFSTFYLI